MALYFDDQLILMHNNLIDLDREPQSRGMVLALGIGKVDGEINMNVFDENVEDSITFWFTSDFIIEVRFHC
jgi:hypothetical protein